MEPGGLCNARAMSLMDSPTLQRSHNSSLPAADNPPGRPSLATYAPPIRTTPKTYPVLHRPVESTAAFFRISFSCRRIFTSLRSLLSSSRSSVVSPSLSPWSISACLTQFLRELPETPSSLATCEMDLPEERTNRIASALNSGGYCALVPGTQNSFLKTLCPQCSGVRGAGSIPSLHVRNMDRQCNMGQCQCKPL